MIIAPGFIGIDVSKHHLDIYDGTSQRIANTAEAIAAWLGRIERTSFVLFEATGRYDAVLYLALDDAGITFARVNPARARDFARSIGVLAKTDALDARMLAAMAQRLPVHPSSAPAADRAALAQLHKRRDQLVAIRQQERTRLHEWADAAMAVDIAAHIDWLDTAIKAIETSIKQQIAASDELSRDRKLLLSIPGVGPVTATTLMALMPEAGTRSSKTIAALAGLAPFNVDTGQFRGRRVIKGGRRRVRNALYMSAVTVTRGKQRFATMYKALIKAGKPPKVALIAVARKILITANAMLRDKTPYRA